MSLKLKLFGIVAIIFITSMICIGYGLRGSADIIESVHIVTHHTFPALDRSNQLRQLIRDSNNAIMMSIDGDQEFEAELLKAQKLFSEVIEDIRIQNNKDPELETIIRRYNEYIEVGRMAGKAFLDKKSDNTEELQKVTALSLELTDLILTYTDSKRRQFSNALDSIISYTTFFKNVFTFSSIGLLATVFILAGIVLFLILAIVRLTNSAISLSGGNLSDSIEVNRKDELGQLQSTFETMRLRLKDHIENLDLKVNERTEELAVAKNDIQNVLDSIAQGIVTFDFEMKLKPEHSHKAEAIFGIQEFQNCRLTQLLNLSPEKEKEFGQWLEIIGTKKGSSNWKKIAKLAPLETYECEISGEWHFFQLEYQPVYENQRIKCIMLLALDITRERQIEFALANSRKEQEEQMQRVMALISSDIQEISGFFSNFGEFIASCKNIKSSAELFDKVNVLFRHLHTAKGNSGTMGFDRMSHLLGLAEDTLAQMRIQPDMNIDIWQQQLLNIENELKEIVSLKSKIYHIGENLMEVNASSYHQLLQKLLSSNQSHFSSIIQELRSLSAQPLKIAGQKYASLVRRLSQRLDKKLFPLHFENPEIPCFKNVLQAFDEAILHIIRNAVDHGIESDDVRHSMHKDHGLISFDYQFIEDQHRIIISDDGRGIDAESIWKKAHDLGFCKTPKEELSDEGKIELIFHQGFSSSDHISEISGRGEGLHAARMSLRELGGDIQIVTEVGKGTRFICSISDQVFLEKKYFIAKTIPPVESPLELVRSHCNFFSKTVCEQFQDMFDVPTLTASPSSLEDHFETDKIIQISISFFGNIHGEYILAFDKLTMAQICGLSEIDPSKSSSAELGEESCSPISEALNQIVGTCLHNLAFNFPNLVIASPQVFIGKRQLPPIPTGHSLIPIYNSHIEVFFYLNYMRLSLC